MKICHAALEQILDLVIIFIIIIVILIHAPEMHEYALLEQTIL